MTREFALRYAAALLRGSGNRQKFEIAFPKSVETLIVADALEQLGCNVEWGQYGHYAVVHAPEVSVSQLLLSSLDKSST
jgi:hypothetical protein